MLCMYLKCSGDDVVSDDKWRCFDRSRPAQILTQKEECILTLSNHLEPSIDWRPTASLLNAQKLEI